MALSCIVLEIPVLKQRLDNSSQAFLTFSTKCVHNTAIDWLDENYFASCSSTADATVCIWDRRMGPHLTAGSTNPESGQVGPSLSLGNAVQGGSIWSLRFSRTKRGCLGVLSSNGQYKMFDIAKEYLSAGDRNSVDETLGQGSSSSYPEQIYTKNVRDIRYPYNHQIRGYKKSARVVSFDFLNMSRANEPSAITLLGDGKVEFVTVQSSAAPIRLSSQNVLVRGIPFGDRDFKTVTPRPLREKTSDIIQSIRENAQLFTSQNCSTEEQEKKCLSSRESREQALFLGRVKPSLKVADALTYLTISQARCREGYLFDCEKNKRIVSDDADLQEFWNWVRRKS